MINFLLKNTKSDARWDCISKAKKIIENSLKKSNGPDCPPKKRVDLWKIMKEKNNASIL